MKLPLKAVNFENVLSTMRVQSVSNVSLDSIILVGINGVVVTWVVARFRASLQLFRPAGGSIPS